MALYKNRETGIIQSHPRSGIGDSLNSDEVGEDSKPVVPLGASKAETKRRVNLAGGSKRAKPKTAATQTSDASGVGKQEGGQ